MVNNDEVTENIVDFSDNSDTDTLEITETQSADLGNTMLSQIN